MLLAGSLGVFLIAEELPQSDSTSTILTGESYTVEDDPGKKLLIAMSC
jgi:hypothetical protein